MKDHRPLHIQDGRADGVRTIIDYLRNLKAQEFTVPKSLEQRLTELLWSEHIPENERTEGIIEVLQGLCEKLEQTRDTIRSRTQRRRLQAVLEEIQVILPDTLASWKNRSLTKNHLREMHYKAKNLEDELRQHIDPANLPERDNENLNQLQRMLWETQIISKAMYYEPRNDACRQFLKAVDSVEPLERISKQDFDGLSELYEQTIEWLRSTLEVKSRFLEPERVSSLEGKLSAIESMQQELWVYSLMEADCV